MVTAPDIPGHKVGGVLGTGGYATVYRAWQVAVGREVAVKVDNRVLFSDRDRRRFVREVTAAGRLSGHPHVIDVYDAGTLTDGRPFLVMELCPAGSLNDALRRHGPMSPGRVRDIGVQIADALAAAHAAGILHRDIKPANILVNRYGIVGLSDFGLASIIDASGDQTASREALTPAYASPESFRGEEPNAAADLYSLTATLYALLAGRPPRFPADGRSPTPAMIMALHDQPVDDIHGTPPDLMELLRQGLDADPAARPRSAVALRDDLARLGKRHSAAQPRPGQPRAAQAPAAQSPGAHARAAEAPAAQGPAAQGPAAPGPAAPGLAAHAPARQVSGGRVSDDQVSGGRGLGGRGLGGRGSGDQALGGWDADPAASGRGPRRYAAGAGVPWRGWRIAALAAAIVVIAGAAAVLGARLVSPPGGTARTGGTAGHADAARATGGSPNVFGIPTVTAGCPAASVKAAGARCPAQPECWAGMVVTSGSATARSMPCTRSHYWETFAIGILPSDARTFEQPTLEKDPAIEAVCSTRVMLASRRGRALRIPASAWRVDVLPPDEAAFYSGVRTYRCVATVLFRQPRGSYFRR